MNQLTRLWVYLTRIHHSLGFGIQSPTDYDFVCHVVNEQGSYYAYDQLNQQEGDWLKHKLGRLYFRLANWRQPSTMLCDEFEPFWKAGCRKTEFVADITHIELSRLSISGNYRQSLGDIYNKVDSQSVLVVEDIYRDWNFWYEIEMDERTGITFDLYYCGIVFFDKKRHKKNYKVNF